MKKFLLRAPATQEKLIMIFPLIHKLVEEFGDDAQINIIAQYDMPNLFEFMKVKCNFFHLPKEKDSMMGIHHYCYNMHDIFNIDAYLDFENSYKSAFMGFAFRAHRRIGIKTGMNKMFLTDMIEPSKNDMYDAHFISFFESLAHKVIRPAPRKEEEQLDNVIPINGVQKDSILIVMTNRNKKLWKDLFDSFLEQEFIIWNETNDDISEDLISWDERNKYQVLSGLNYLKVKELFEKHKIVMSDNYIYGTIASYLDCDTYIFTKGSQNNPYFEYLDKNPTIVKMKNDVPEKICSDTQTEVVREMSEFVDKVVERFKL